MSIEIEVLNGEHSRPQAETLFRQIEPYDAPGNQKGNENEPGWARITWADPDLRVMVDDPDSGLVCHAGIFFRTVTWNGQKVHVGGVGQVATHPDHRRRGYASIALEAAVQTMRHHDAAQFAVLLRTAQLRILSIAGLASVYRDGLCRAAGRKNPLRGHGAVRARSEAACADTRHARHVWSAVVTDLRAGFLLLCMPAVSGEI